MQPKVQVSAKQFAAKYNSKYEIYRFLTVDCHYYLSPYNTVSIYFLKDLISGSKKRRSSPLLTLFPQTSTARR